MRIKKRYFVWGLILTTTLAVVLGAILTFYHSNPRMPSPQNADKKESVEGNLKRVNKFLAEKDQERIRSFVQRRGWNMQRTGSGLWYMIDSPGGGMDIEQGMHVKMNYEIRLLDGTLCYSSDSLGAKVFRVGEEDEPQGLHEAMKRLHEGDHARIIMPPHLAHGLIGDGERIPARAILVYDVQVLKASPRKIRR